MSMLGVGEQVVSPARETFIGCGVKTLSFMPSVLIPLPPLIPLPLSDTPTLDIITHKKTMPRVFVISPLAEEKKHRIYYDFEKINILDHNTKTWRFTLPQGCASLDKKQILIEYRHSKHSPAFSSETYNLHYENKGIELEWGYFVNN